MEGHTRFYVLGCIASIFVPIFAIIEWHSLLSIESFFLRILAYASLSIPLIFMSWAATFLVAVIIFSLFKESKSLPLVSTLVALVPWVIGVVTCYDHLVYFPVHYCKAMALTAFTYVVQEFWFKSRVRYVGKDL